MFRLVTEPIQGPLIDPEESSGAVVVFEGRVRNTNEGREVIRLEYEAFDPLATQEANQIIEAVLKRYKVQQIACVHLVGSLELGEVAIRVEVASGHRKEAFKACSAVVDEIKKRVPIWKKEHYVDGESEWLNIQAPPTDDEDAFYARQTRLPEVGAEGQAKLKAANVLVVGAGGLGSPALLYLAAAGIGTIGICEAETLEASNLHRQILFAHEEVGQPKSLLASERIQKLNPFITVNEHPFPLTRGNVGELVQQYDIVLDCTDNFETKFLLNDACVGLNKTLIFASVYQYEGQLFVVEPHGPCLRCLWPTQPAAGCVGNCAEVGVLGFVPGVLGTLQAAEAVKRMLGLNTVASSLILIDLVDLNITRISVAKDPACPTCGEGEVDELWWEIHPDSLDQLSQFAVVDIREEEELETEPLPIDADVWLPMSSVTPEEILSVSPGNILLVCRSGMRTARMANAFSEAGEKRVYSLAGGLSTLRRLQGPN
ncbi:MAG TPA: ThiF family adenylyltransferase [Fimbriimonadaceae bacterium]